MVSASKEIWDYLLSCKIFITTEYIPGVTDLGVDWGSRNLKDTSEWKLCVEIFKMVTLGEHQT